MQSAIPNYPEVDILSTVFVRYPQALSTVEARLFALAIDSLTRNPQRATFQFAFSDIIPGGNEDGTQYEKLCVAMKRLMQAIKFKLFHQGNSCTHYMLLFSTLGIDPVTESVKGKFNSDLKAYLLDLGDKFTFDELESLLMLRQ